MRNNNKLKIEKGFTLIELLLVIGILGILMSSLVLVINPARQMAKARDTQRQSDLFAILATIYQYSAEHSGALPDTDGDPETSNFPTESTCIGNQAPCYNLASAGEEGETIVPVYMAQMLQDPETGTEADTQYFISVDENGRLVASAIGETTDEITVTR